MKGKINKNIFDRSIDGPEGEIVGSQPVKTGTEVLPPYRTSPEISNRIYLLAEGIKKGEIDTRINLSGITGDDRELLKTINEMLEVLTDPLQMAIDCSGEISAGGIPERITGNYRGDFNQLKNNFNSAVDLINNITDELKGLIDGINQGETGIEADADKLPGLWRKILKGINEVLHSQVSSTRMTAEYIERIAQGNTPAKITADCKGDFRQIKLGLNANIDIISSFVDEVGVLMNAVEEGKLDIRADADKFPGVWRKILKGTNEIIDMLARPTRLAEEYIDRISKGDTPEKITAEYKGDFNQIKNSLNANIDIISSFVDEIGILMNAVEAGKLDVRANADNFPGVWRKILKGTNEVVDMLVAPTKLAGEYVDRISRGDTPERITEEYKGDFNQIKNSLNANIDIISGFVDEIGILMNAVGDGKLDIRANADNFPGVWRKILRGTNEVIDDFVRPLNIAAEYIDRIGKGDIPEKITDEYKGDFNEIKNNVNLCIDGLEGLVESSEVLHKLAINDHQMKVEGKYQGIYAKTAQSVNDVRERLLAVATVNNNIAVGDFSEDLKMYKGIGKRSEEDQIVPSYIRMMENIMGMGEEVIELTKAAEEGKLDYRADATRFEGQFREVVEGVNNAVNAFVAPLNIAAEYIDRISKGDIPEKITDEYKGDFNEIRNNINACIDGLEGLVESSQVLGRMARNDYTIKVEGEYQGIFAETARAVNRVQAILVDILNICLKIGDGDYMKWLQKLQRLGKLSKEDIILPAFIKMMENIDELGEAVIELTDAAEEGKLDYRADTDKFKGKFKEVVQGVNNAVDTFMEPLNITAQYVDRIGKGDIPEKITEDYKGDFNQIKDNINACIDGLGGLVESSEVLRRMARNDYTIKVEGEYQGIFAETARAVNGVQAILVDILNICLKIADGDYIKWLQRLQKLGKLSQEDIILPAFVNMMENIDALGEEVIGLTGAAQGGKLDYRADAGKFKGKFKEVVQGVNNAVDAFIAPLNITAEYVERISKGDIPEKITDEYKGDFNEIKDNINACIDGLGGLVESSEVLKRMARNDYTLKVEGEYQGIFAETAKAVNGVQAILVDILNICLKIGEGDYIKWLQRLQKLGKLSQEDIILPAFIKMMENIDALGEAVIELTIAAEAGQLGYRADTSQFKGKFHEVIQGVNNAVDALVTPLNMTAGYVDRISKGDIPEKITADYKGDFNEIKDNLNVLIKALDEVTATAKEIAGGNLTVQVKERSERDELMRSLKAMVNNLQDIAIGLRDDSNELAGSAQELSANAEEITAGANETAATMVQVAATVAQVSDNAIEIKDVADRASAEAERGQEDVNTVNSQMRDISESTDNAANVVKELNNTSNKIGKIVETIANIASQTNLLALNAAIEAARAGDHGRGFAVVAEEVRKLAEQSATAAEEIRELITNIQRESNQAVEVMNESMERVESGVEIVNHTGESFAQIINQVKALAEQVDEIASGIEETSAAIQNVTNITKESTAATEDMANATQAQAELAADLQEMAARFRLN